NKMLYVGYLHQNWLGIWNLEDRFGNKGPIGDITFNPNPEEQNGVVWGVSGISRGSNMEYSYVYGMIVNSQVEEIKLTVDDEINDIPMFKSNGKRFFFLKREGDSLPFNLRALSESGKVIETES
ncbi:hypothetical protein, partial [Virgibacillus sp. DJP39]|uniref:hypothetical protein n=1 Tax=Virgibacillus sp. DJP39 TaxID=3409790 RepID=UPI003BB5F3AC